MLKLNRRHFLGLSVVSAVSAATPVMAMSDMSLPRKWDKTVDVLVVGAGGAGLSAAITA